MLLPRTFSEFEITKSYISILVLSVSAIYNSQTCCLKQRVIDFLPNVFTNSIYLIQSFKALWFISIIIVSLSGFWTRRWNNVSLFSLWTRIWNIVQFVDLNMEHCVIVRFVNKNLEHCVIVRFVDQNLEHGGFATLEDLFLRHHTVIRKARSSKRICLEHLEVGFCDKNVVANQGCVTYTHHYRACQERVWFCNHDPYTIP